MKWVGHMALRNTAEVRRGFCWGVLRERDHLKDLGVDRRVISEQISKKWHGGGMDWTDLAQDRDR